MVSTSAPPSATATATGLQYLPTDAATASPNQSLLPLTAQVNEHQHLTIGGCDVKDLVEQFGSPLYILDETTLRTACTQYREAFRRFYPGESQVLYASKAWNCLAVCAIVASEGLGLDVVSGGELYTAVQAGVDPAKIYLHGNNKSEAELKLALDVGCTIVVDNWHELDTLSRLAAATGKTAAQPQRVMIRFTPGIECHTHEYIRTGHLDSKFGFDPDQLPALFQRLVQEPSLSCIGLHAHIGSQIFELKPHEDLAGVVIKAFIDAQALGLPVAEVNVGGGLGIRYTESDDPPSIDTWAETVCTALVQACNQANLPLPKLLCEPGRSLIGPACITAYTVGTVKDIPGVRT
ncbi:MAG: diaminopimelate decarboxylase, partial [Prochlorothrix sp.]